MFGLGQLCDVVADMLKGYELAAAGQRDPIVEVAGHSGAAEWPAWRGKRFAWLACAPIAPQSEQKFRGLVFRSKIISCLPVEHPDTQFWPSTIEVAPNRLELAPGRKQPSTTTNHRG